MAPASYARNLPTYYLYRFLGNLAFWMPIWVIYLQEVRGLSLTQIGLIDASFWLVGALSEVPTGVVADVWSRKTSLLLGLALQIVALLLYGLAPSWLWILIASIVWGIALSFTSGAAEALIYDTLCEMGREEEYTTVSGRALMLRQSAWVLAGLLGGWLAAWDLRLPYLLTALLGLVVMGLAARLQEPPMRGEGEARPSYWHTIRQAARQAGSSPAVRFALGYGAVFPLASFTVGMLFLQPHALALGIPVAGMGLVMVLVRGAGIIGGAQAGRIVGWAGENRWLTLAPLLVIGGLLLLSVTHSLWGLLLLALIIGVSATASPALEGLLLRSTAPSVRATMFSAQSLLFTLLVAAVQPVLGYLGDHYHLSTAYAFLGGLMSLLLLPLLAMWFVHLRHLPVEQGASTPT